MMDFDAFAERARELAASYPPDLMEGIETVEVHRDSKPHPHLPDVVTLGECASSPHDDPSGQEPLRSILHVYYGSFVELAREDESFDMEEELDLTLRHEIQHHLEDRAGERSLRDDDDLFEAHARFRAGQEVPAGWYRRGEALEEGLWAVDLDLFLELPMSRRAWERFPGRRVTLTILDAPFELDVPKDARPDEIWTFEGEGLVEGDDEGEEPGPGDLAGDLHVLPSVR